MKKLNVNQIIPLNVFENTQPIVIDVVYAKPDHPDNLFKDLYSPHAKVMWAHKDIAAVTIRAAQICHERYGWKLKINDCLRPVEGQEGMAVYGYDPSVVSVPGSGAHPRAMAIDIEPIDSNGNLVPMGTSFDFFSENVREDNPAARNYTKFDGSNKENEAIWMNRQRLEFAMRYAATSLGRELLPLPEEWWDFRELENVWGQWQPLREDDLHSYQRLINDVDPDSIKRILNGNIPSEIQPALNEVRKIIGESPKGSDVKLQATP